MIPKYKTLIQTSKKNPSKKTEIKYIENGNENYLKNLTLPFELSNTEDIIHNVYEGGFKVWECSLDVIDFLEEFSEKIILKDKSVLDLGCGQGLLGIYALQKTAKSVLFQDFNIEVLKYFTFLNIEMNFPNFIDISDKVKFISGDWSDFPEKLSKNNFELIKNKDNQEEGKITDRKFDLILMSEVIYKTENYDKIAQIIEKLLKPKGEGICILGTKLYYFGVGGSLPEFEEFLLKNYPTLKVVDISEINTKKSNKRAIVIIQKT